MSLTKLNISFGCLLSLVVFAACEDDQAASSDECAYHSDCAEDELCSNGQCMAECREDRDCPTGESCVRGGCSSDEDLDGTGGGEDAEADTGRGDVPDAGEDSTGEPLPDIGGPRPGGHGEIAGIVHFRLYDDSILPVAEPQVYWTYPESPPAPLNPESSCDCGYPATAVTGAANGEFLLEDIPAGWVYLVVQKGNFRARRLVEVVPDERLQAPLPLTELPVINQPENGLEIPRIVIGTGRFDTIEDIFAKLRMGPITPTFAFDYEAYMEDPSAWSVELNLYQQPRDMADNDLELIAPSFTALLSDREALDDYHLVFAPCAEYDTYGTLLTSEAVRNNIHEYVNGGGKLYVTDYAYDLIEQTFPAYIDFLKPEQEDGNADGHIGDTDYMGIAAYGTLMYESENRAHDDMLVQWLDNVDGSDDGKVLTTGNWVNLNGVNTVPQCCDDEGEWVDTRPEVVMTGPNGIDPFIGDFGPSHDSWEDAADEGANRPHTLTFSYGCGEVMYSTYHTVDWQDRSANIAPQELVLLYLILEINECNLDPIKD